MTPQSLHRTDERVISGKEGADQLVSLHTVACRVVVPFMRTVCVGFSVYKVLALGISEFPDFGNLL